MTLKLSLLVEAATKQAQRDLRDVAAAEREVGAAAKGTDTAAGSARRLDEATKSAATTQRTLRQAVVETSQATQATRDASDGLASSLGLIGRGAAAFIAIDLARSAVGSAVALDSLDQRFKSVFGSSEAAADELAFIRAEADRLGVSFISLAGEYSSLSAAAKGTTLEGERTRDIFSAITEAGAKLQLSQEQIAGALTAVQQIVSKGTVSAEELRGQLGERLPGAFQIAARAMGVTTAELGKLLESGTLASDVFLPKFAVALRQAVGTDASTRIESVASNFTRLRNEIEATGASLGKFATERLSPLASDTATLLQALREDPGNASLTLARQLGLQLQGRNAEANATFDLLKTRNSARDFVRNNPFTPQIDPFATNSRFSVVPNQAAQTGPGILAEGVPIADQKELSKLLQEQTKYRQTLADATALQRVEESILNGELKGRNILEQEAAREVARLQDAITAKNTAARSGAAQQKSDDEARLAALREEIAAEERIQSIVNALQTPQEQFARRLAEINRSAADGTFAEAGRRLGVSPSELQNRALIDAGNALPNPGEGDAAVEKAKANISELSVFAQEGARGIQSAFADFLFAPLDGGLAGFARNFGNTLRRLAAEAAASSFLKAIVGSLSGSSNGFLASIGVAFGGPRATGGGVNRGMLYETNEARPELLSVGNKDYLLAGRLGGRVTPLQGAASGGGGGTSAGVNIGDINIDARGAQDPTAIFRAGAALKADILQSVAKAMQRGYSPGSN